MMDKSNDKIHAYVYSLDKSGMVVMRQGVVILLPHVRNELGNYSLAMVGKQRLIVGSAPNVLSRGIMWSDKPNGQLFISLMKEELYKRRTHHQRQIKRINAQLSTLQKAAKTYK